MDQCQYISRVRCDEKDLLPPEREYVTHTLLKIFESQSQTEDENFGHKHKRPHIADVKDNGAFSFAHISEPFQAPLLAGASEQKLEPVSGGPEQVEPLLVQPPQKVEPEKETRPKKKEKSKAPKLDTEGTSPRKDAAAQNSEEAIGTSNLLEEVF
jgi:hypothetical protein